MSIGFFDIETLKTADEVGGWEYVSDMGFGVGCLYVDEQRSYELYLGKDSTRQGVGCYPGIDDTEAFLKDLLELDLLVGFNCKAFDYKVLQPYATGLGIQLDTIPTFDMLEALGDSVGRPYPAGLESLGTLNLGQYGKKTADAREVVKMYRAGLIDEVLAYCIHDVWITRMLFMQAYTAGTLQMRERRGAIKEVDVSRWKDTVDYILKREITIW